jgi:hypothetical protein
MSSSTRRSEKRTVRDYSLGNPVNAIMRRSADERQAWEYSTLVVGTRPHAAK